MKNIDRIQTNILKMINQYVGKKYIYILCKSIIHL